MRSILSVFVLCFAAVACEGPMGPEGPTGPMGPTGPPAATGEPGEATRLTYEGWLSNTGFAEVILPQEAGHLDDPPLVSCYIGNNGGIPGAAAGSYYQVGFDGSAGGARCAIRNDTSGRLGVQIISGPDGWAYIIVVVY